MGHETAARPVHLSCCVSTDVSNTVGIYVEICLRAVGHNLDNCGDLHLDGGIARAGIADQPLRVLQGRPHRDRVVSAVPWRYCCRARGHGLAPADAQQIDRAVDAIMDERLEATRRVRIGGAFGLILLGHDPGVHAFFGNETGLVACHTGDEGIGQGRSWLCSLR